MIHHILVGYDGSETEDVELEAELEKRPHF
jgi:hypothetical protein